MATNSEMEYRTVLVVGNGFDISFRLKTSYKDYLDSSKFREIKNNPLVDYICRKKELEQWVDIERALSDYSNSLYFTFENGKKEPTDGAGRIERLRNNYIELCDNLKSYLLNVSKTELSANNIADDVLSELFHCGSLYVLTFNYTNTMERILDERSSPYKYAINHIHGSLKGEIVFGVEDKVNLSREHVFLYKSHNQYKSTRGLPEILKNADKIVFFGYSLGETDHSYFDDFFNEQTMFGCKSKEFVFYYYGEKEENYDDLIWQLRALTKNRLSYLSQYNDINFIDSYKPIALKK